MNVSKWVNQQIMLVLNFYAKIHKHIEVFHVFCTFYRM